MKKTTTLILFFTLLFMNAMPQQFEWVKTYASSMGELRCVIIANDHNYIACGQKPNSIGYILKTDTSGALIWNKAYNYLKEIFQIVQTNDGGFALYATNKTTNKGMFIKTDLNCDTLWSITLKGVSRNNKCFIQTSDNGYALAYTNTDTLFLTKLNSSGSQLWSKQFYHVFNATSISQASDGGFLISANITNNGYILKTNSVGDSLWANIVNISGTQELMGVVESNDHNYVSVYNIYAGCDYITNIRKMTSFGSVLWEHRILGTYYSTAWSLCNTKDHGFIVAGYFLNPNIIGGFEYAISKIDSIGVEKDLYLYSGTGSGYSYSVVQENDSIFITSGYTSDGSAGSGLPIPCLAKLKANKNLLAITEFYEPTQLSVYPNPVKEVLTIETNSNKNQSVEIFNLFGQTVYTNIINKKATINTSTFANDVYIIKLSSDKETVVRKFVKE
ncbi:MAG: T9SS type A sorting domain-containing protein [Bacteroidetes bacterium]|nr:T9SS type A sorting domain-containing protein [Bacteroidota bacterium]